MVPSNWNQTRLENIAKIKSGSTPLRAKQDLYFSEDGTPWVKTLDLNNSEIIRTDERITELALKETSCSILPTNTVLVAMYGGFNQIGRTGLLTQPSAINQALSGLILDLERAEPKYVLDYLNGNVGQWKKFAASSRKDPNITRQDVCSFEILLPPLPEQQKIAKILSTWDKAISTTERLIENSTQQKKALMQQLLTGKKRLLDESGKRFEGEWESLTIGDVIELFNGYAFKSSDALEKGYKWLKIANVGIGEIKWNDSSYLPEEYENEYSRFNLKVGDVVVAMTRPTLGNKLKIARLKNKSDEALLNQRVAKLLFSDAVNSEYMYQLLSTIEVALKLNSALLGTDPPNLSAKVLHQIDMELPPLVEQQKIATVLTNADKEIELLEKQLADLQQEKKALMQQLLTGKRRVKVEVEQSECV